MKRFPVWRLLIAAVIYAVLFVPASACGMFHPACYAYVGTVVPLLFSFIYLYSCAQWQHPGAAAILNCILLAIGFIAGEGNLPFAVIIVVVTVLAEILRKVMKYDTLKGVRVSFVPFAFSFYAYSAHWWFDTENSLAEAVGEMPAGYADKMSVVIDNIPVLVLMLALTVPVAILGMRIAEKAMKKQTALLK